MLPQDGQRKLRRQSQRCWWEVWIWNNWQQYQKTQAAIEETQRHCQKELAFPVLRKLFFQKENQQNIKESLWQCRKSQKWSEKVSQDQN